MKKILYIDMDNTLVDFGAALLDVDADVLKHHEGREDEIPGLFARMPAVDGAIAAFQELSQLFDTYILSTAPWLNPSAWQHKLEWVHTHLGMDRDTPAYKRLILSHHKNLNRGDYLVDDRPGHNGADAFDGEVIPFGQSPFESWSTVTDYLVARA